MAGLAQPRRAPLARRVPEQIGPEDLDEHFKLSPADLRFALKRRGDSRLGVAVQLCALRWLGFVREALTEVPQPALLELCKRLEANPADLDTHGARSQTRTDQLTAASVHADYFDAMRVNIAPSSSRRSDGDLLMAIARGGYASEIVWATCAIRLAASSMPSASRRSASARRRPASFWRSRWRSPGRAASARLSGHTSSVAPESRGA
jgi:hypothetical protein